MPIDEAPRLTLRVTVAASLLVFLLCVFMERLKCHPGASQSFCIGPAYVQPCAMDSNGNVVVDCPVDGSVFNVNPEGQRGDQEVVGIISYTVEIGPSTAADSPFTGNDTAAALLANALRARLVEEYQDRLTSSRTASEGRLTGPIIIAVHDRVTLPYVNLTERAEFDNINEWATGARADDAWLQALERLLPMTLSQQTRPDAVRAHFPALNAVLSQLHRNLTSAGALGRRAVMLSVSVIVNPGVYLDKWVSLRPVAADGQTPLTQARLQARVVAAVARNYELGYQRLARALLNVLSFKRPYARTLNLVKMNRVLLPFPALHFAVADPSALRALVAMMSTEALPVPAELRAFMRGTTQAERVDVVANIARQTPIPTLKCAATGGEEVFACGEACRYHARQSPFISRMEEDLHRGYTKAFHDARSARPALFGRDVDFGNGTVVRRFRNCYAAVLACGVGSGSGDGRCAWADGNPWPGAADPFTGGAPDVFVDCLHLTPAGSRALASCLVLNMQIV